MRNVKMTANEIILLLGFNPNRLLDHNMYGSYFYGIVS